MGLNPSKAITNSLDGDFAPRPRESLDLEIWQGDESEDEGPPVWGSGKGGVMYVLPTLLRLRKCTEQTIPRVVDSLRQSKYKTVDAHESQIGDQSAGLLAAAEAMGGPFSVRDWRLPDNNLTSVGCRAMARMLSTPGNEIEALDLSRNDLGQGGAHWLAEAIRGGRAVKLRELHLACCAINSAGATELAEALASSPSVPLTHLDLSENPVGDTALTALAPIASRLRLLALTDCGLADVTELGRALAVEGSSMETLRMDKNRIGDAGARAVAHAIAGCPRLRRLELQNCDIGNEGVQRLAEAVCDSPSVAVVQVGLNRFDEQFLRIMRDAATYRPGGDAPRPNLSLEGRTRLALVIGCDGTRLPPGERLWRAAADARALAARLEAAGYEVVEAINSSAGDIAKAVRAVAQRQSDRLLVYIAGRSRMGRGGQGHWLVADDATSLADPATLLSLEAVTLELARHSARRALALVFDACRREEDAWRPSMRRPTQLEGARADVTLVCSAMAGRATDDGGFLAGRLERFEQGASLSSIVFAGAVRGAPLPMVQTRASTPFTL